MLRCSDIKPFLANLFIQVKFREFRTIAPNLTCIIYCYGLKNTASMVPLVISFIKKKKKKWFLL